MRKSRKILSVILAVLLLVCSAVPAFAASEKQTPVIVVSGMGTFPLYSGDEQIFPMENTKIVKAVSQIVLPLTGSVATNDWEIFAKYGTKPIHDLFEKMRCDENGDSVYEVHTKTFPESAGNYKDTFHATRAELSVVERISEKIGWDNTYFFSYDWRINPMKLADDLSDTVKKVMNETGSSKVSLVAMSFGGTITSAYIYKYGTQSLKNVVYASTAFMGTSIVGGLFSGNPTVKLGDALEYLATAVQDSKAAAALVGISAKALSTIGVKGEKAVNDYIKAMFEVLQYPAYSEIFMDTFAHFQGIWCLMGGEYYEAAKKYMPTVATFSDKFFEETDEYMYNVQAKTQQLLEAAKSDGVNVSIISAYGYSGIPLTPDANKQTDTLIDSDFMSGNCAVAPFGKTLSDMDYSKENACTQHNHVSTDNQVDASVGMLPENTWLIKNMNHVEYSGGEVSGNLLVFLATSNKPVDVHSDARYPQFIELDRQTRTYSSLTEGVKLEGENAASPSAVFAVIIEFIKKLCDFIFGFLTK